MKKIATVFLTTCLVGAYTNLTACDGGGVVSSVTATKVMDTMISQDQVKKLLGKYEIAEDSKYYKIDISADKIRCNYSNNTSKYKSIKYSLAKATGDEYFLLAEGGFLKATHDTTENTWSFESTGICSWGVNDSPYTQKSTLEGSPSIAINSALTDKMSGKSGKVGEDVALPDGTIKLKGVKAASWKGDDGDTPVLELNFEIKNSSKAIIDLFFIDGGYNADNFASASCGESSSTGLGNPQFKKHRKPVFAEGGGWVSATATIVPSKTRKGYLSLQMSEKASGKCTIKINGAALGGGEVSIDAEL